MLRRLVPIAALLLIPTLPLTAATDEVPIRVVVHADIPVTELTAAEVSRIFKGKIREWDDGTAAVPVDRNLDAEVRAIFSAAIHGSSVERIQSYWARRVFSAHATPPALLSSDEDVLDFVAENRGAIGYVSARTPLVPGVRVLEITGVRTAGGRPPAADRARETIAAERGDVQILLTGACGPDGQGREAILLHRNRHATVRVTTETSRWWEGRFDSRSRQHHTLAGHQEKRLGCTRLSQRVEQRYDLADVSDNAVRADPRLDHERPPRDFIAFVEAGTCGHGGHGRRVAVVNEHRSREIRISVERLERLEGKLRSRSKKSYRLAPGGDKELGCSRDGRVAYEFYLVKAE